MTYAAYKKQVLGKKIGSGQCVALIRDYWSSQFSVSAYTVAKSVVGAKDLLKVANTKYLDVIKNDHSNVNQLPKQGDVMVFDATPKAGYSNRTDNPYGHTGICEKANSQGYWLLQQNAPRSGQSVNVTFYPWKFRPCTGWLRSKPQVVPAPVDPHLKAISDLQDKVHDLQAEIADADDANAKLIAENVKRGEQITTLTKQLTIVQNENAKLKAQVGEATKWETLKALLRELLGN